MAAYGWTAEELDRIVRHNQHRMSRVEMQRDWLRTPMSEEQLMAADSRPTILTDITYGSPHSSAPAQRACGRAEAVAIYADVDGACGNE